jgi:hypothetical protein
MLLNQIYEYSSVGLIVAIKKGTSSQLPQKTPMKDCIQFNFDIYNESLSNLILKSGITKGELVRK